MVLCGFIFDVIIVRIDAPNYQFEDQTLLKVEINFNNIPLTITSSRINVVEFRSGRSYEFEADPNDLKNDLLQIPMSLSVEYAGELIGFGSMEWPIDFVEKIKEDIGELTHVGEVDIIYNEEKVGLVEIIIRFQCKCREIE